MIWCVEDDASIRDIEVYALNSTGLAAEGFADGAAFWQALQKTQPELVVLDVMLPEIDGIELLRRMKGLPCHFNLIPLNHVEESPLKPSSREAVALFQKTLEDGGIPATVRRTLGGDIDASCGQLRRKYTKNKEQ